MSSKLCQKHVSNNSVNAHCFIWLQEINGSKPDAPEGNISDTFVRWFLRSPVRRENCLSMRTIFRRRENFSKTRSGRRDRFRQKIVKIGAILTIFESFEVRKYRTPFFGEFGRSSQDLGESDYNSIKSRDDRLNSPKSGMWIFHRVR